MGRPLDGETLRRAMGRFLEALRAHREEIDSLNVFPVPDGDTGTNLLLTQEAVVDALSDAGADLGGVGEAISRAALMGARGNSGVILSQALRGLCRELATTEAPGARELAAALRAASDEARRAVAEPVEGTMLTVLRDASDAAEEAARTDGGADEVAAAALDAARASVERTPELLPELARAGVVDAGARGVSLLFDALVAALRDAPLSVEVGPMGPVGRSDEIAAGSSAFGFEVMYLLEAPDDAVPAVRSALSDLGDSLVVVGGEGLYNVHVHTDDPDAAVGVGERAGTPSEVRVTSLDEQVARQCLAGEARAVRVAGDATEAEPATATAIVAIAPGPGVTRLFASLGASVIDGGPGHLPSVAEILEGVERARGESVVLLPNHPNAIPGAERAAAEATRPIEVVPTRSVLEGIAAATACNPEATLSENAAEAKEAASRVVTVEVASAVREAETPAGPVLAGDALGVVDGDVRTVGSDPVAVAVETLRLVVGDAHEVATVLVGEGVADDDAARLVREVAAAHPGLEVEVHRGDQPHYPLLIGIE